MDAMRARGSYEPRRETVDLSVSVVVYRPDLPLFERTLASLADAWTKLRGASPEATMHVCIVDNGGLPDIADLRCGLDARGIASTVLSGHGNVGYGRGHNLAIDQTQSRYHLVLNPDIDLDASALAVAFAFFDAHPQAGLLTPRICGDDERMQYLCRRYPSLFDLLARGFFPPRARVWCKVRLARYEMRDVINERDVVWDPPIVSGCFMLFRTPLLHRLGGFDPRYFLYFEDYDLSLRTHELSRIAYVPAVRVLHHGGGAARKGAAHIRMFAASALKFYNRFGWKLL